MVLPPQIPSDQHHSSDYPKHSYKDFALTRLVVPMGDFPRRGAALRSARGVVVALKSEFFLEAIFAHTSPCGQVFLD